MNRLTDRQRHIMEMVAQGFTDKEIATNFNCALSTIRNTQVTIKDKLGAKTRAEAVFRLFTTANPS